MKTLDDANCITLFFINNRSVVFINNKIKSFNAILIIIQLVFSNKLSIF